MKLFLIMTPAQLLNAIVLSETVFKNEKCDAYMTSNLEGYVPKVKCNGIFNEIFSYELVPDLLGRDNVIKRGIVRVKNALDVKSIKHNLPSDPFLYNTVLVSGISLRNYEVYYAIKSINRETNISLYEEGICEYYHLMENSKSKKIFSYIFFHSYYLEDCKQLYVYEPSVVNKNWENIIVKSIPKFIYIPDLMRKLTDVFSIDYKINESFKNKVVFLESNFYEEQKEELQMKIIKQLIEEFGGDNVVVKLHPRSSIDKYDSDINTITTSIPLEMIVANINDDDLALVSLTTSAIINPKLMLNKEPLIVCLNQLNRTNLSESDRVFDRVSALYKANRFFIPKTMEQLREVLRALKYIISADGSGGTVSFDKE